MSLLVKEPFLRMLNFYKTINLLVSIKFIPENCNLGQLFDFFKLPRNNIIKLQQIKSELLKLLEKIKKLRPRIILEIGTLNGGTLFLFSRVIDTRAIIISIDLPKRKFNNLLPDWRIPLIKRFPLQHQKLKLIRANSHKASTLSQVKKIIDSKKIDFVFIDASHSYEGVKKDFEMYSPLVKDDGIIAFHDIVNLSGSINTVYKFWEQIKNQYDFDEFYEDPTQKTGGIGVIKYKTKIKY
ncbi:MAG: class I SAM-dependent methyltransferase [Promethearchaeota archaeon]